VRLLVCFRSQLSTDSRIIAGTAGIGLPARAPKTPVSGPIERGKQPSSGVEELKIKLRGIEKQELPLGLEVVEDPGQRSAEGAGSTTSWTAFRTFFASFTPCPYSATRRASGNGQGVL
jgi:hypothetical protein